jgi:hypothetical protein
MFKKMIKDMLTERDGITFCLVRVLGCFSFFSIHALAFIHATRDCHNFNYIEIAGGITMILSAISAGSTYKYTKES